VLSLMAVRSPWLLVSLIGARYPFLDHRLLRSRDGSILSPN